MWLLLVLVRIEFGFKVFRRCLGKKGASYRHFIGKTAIDANKHRNYNYGGGSLEAGTNGAVEKNGEP